MPDAPTRHIAHLTVPADPGYLAIGRLALTGLASGLEVSDQALEDLKFALSEACGNAIRHGYAGEPGVIEITFAASDEELEVVVADQGRGLDPSHALSGDGESLGIGLSMIRAVASRWRVESGPGGRGTVVTFARTFDG